MRTTQATTSSAAAPGIPAASGPQPGTGTPGGTEAGLPANARVAPSAGPVPDCGAARRPGRPRSEQAEQAILDATLEAVGDRGIDGVSCEDVAARAGVGKATLYRRWPGKEDLLIAAFAALKRPLPEPRGESVRADLIAMLEVMAEDAEDPRFAQQYVTGAVMIRGKHEELPAEPCFATRVVDELLVGLAPR
jgi:AcrR family transcriptional regulator